MLHNLLNDIKGDTDYTLEENDDGFIILTNVNYSNNKELVKQKIYIDKDVNIYKVEVLDHNDLVKIKMNISNLTYNNDVDVDYFKLNNYISVSSDMEREMMVSTIDDVLYPMYIPQNTYLSSQDKILKENGERIILTFAGDSPFMLIQETITYNNDVVSVYGEPYHLVDSVGILGETSVTWFNDGIEYYLVSNVLNQDELINVANSLTVSLIEK